MEKEVEKKTADDLGDRTYIVLFVVFHGIFWGNSAIGHWLIDKSIYWPILHIILTVICAVAAIGYVGVGKFWLKDWDRKSLFTLFFPLLLVAIGPIVGKTWTYILQQMKQ